MQTPNSNIDSSLVTSAIVRKHSSVRYRHRRLIEEKTDIQSNAVSSAICRLPTEILSEIFMHCVVPDETQDEHLSPRAKQAPILLTTICHRWRAVAINLPRLWCKLQLDFRFNGWEKKSSGYTSWLKRTKACPLSLKLIGSWNNMDKLQSIIQPHAQQITSLTLKRVTANAGPFIMEDFHALEELTIHHAFNFPKQDLDRSLSKLPVNLRRLNMPELIFNRKKLNFFADSAWARLTHLDLRIKGLDAFIHILRLCPNVTSLTMEASFSPIEHVAPVTHVNLRTLHMFWSVLRTSSEILFPLTFVTLPNLCVLQARHKKQWSHKEFMAFMTRSKCSLETLILSRSEGIKAEQEEECAALVSSLKLITVPDTDEAIYDPYDW
ncbi:hypothetical protein BDR07DRAFT_1371308 [Suillus spraguei]|nr:hypothetical protein BDR07DRAFT_1371308 [Suillus spraguei]